MIKKHADAIGHAVDGLLWAVRTQPNYKIHFSLILLSVVVGWFLNISYTEWMVILVTSLLGIIIETVNTSIEKMGDAVDTNYNENIKISKDVSASAMLLYSLGAIIVAGIIFIPKLLDIFY
ncbi:MAG: diacylglycerol kinase family protein [Candidatus Roizmanbacteria bacterium]|nr:diacylglycerol kinase family protein [Candidatus Roizmanbacteria bacterium]